MRVKSNISRRELLAGAISAPMLAGAQSQPARPKLAAITTTYFKYSHTQHIVDRFLEGYGWNGTHHHPQKGSGEAISVDEDVSDHRGSPDVRRQ
jgi:hypothetical protein